MTKKEETNIEKEFKQLKLELAQLEEEKASLTEIAQRAAADLQNFRRRIEEERADLRIFANAELITSLFPTIDNLKRAFDHLPEELAENEWVKGIQAIENHLSDNLSTRSFTKL